MPKRYPSMVFDPEQWVDNQIKEFGTCPCKINAMLVAMEGSLVPDKWISEALDRSMFHYEGGVVQ